MHQTYHLTTEYQRKLVLVPLRNHYRCFSNTFYDFRNMHLDQLDDLINLNEDNNEIHYTAEENEILDGFNLILDINPKF